MRADLAPPVHVLAEWQSVEIPGATLTAADLRLKAELESGEEGRLAVDELRDGVRVTARSWVGVVRFAQFEVRVVPKLAGGNFGLVEMIEIASGLDALRRSTSARDLDAREVGLLDLLALLFAEAVESVVRTGILADYVEREDELPVVRGRLLGDVQLRRRFGQIDRLASHQLAWVLLDGLGTKDLLAAGQTRCFAFLIDMNRLFEQFVYRVIDRLLASSGLRVRYQRGDRSIILNSATEQPYSRVIPDLLVEDRDAVPPRRVALDAKYKLYDEKKLASGDIYQAFLYAYAYGRQGGGTPPSAVLLYPASTSAIPSLTLSVRSAEALVGAEILAMGIPIRSLLDEIAANRVGPVANALREAIDRSLGIASGAAA